MFNYQKKSKAKLKRRRYGRIKKMFMTSDLVRVVFSPSNTAFFAQAINDRKGNKDGGITLCSLSTKSKEIKKLFMNSSEEKKRILSLKNKKVIEVFAEKFAELLIAKKINNIKFDCLGSSFQGKNKLFVDVLQQKGIILGRGIKKKDA